MLEHGVRPRGSDTGVSHAARCADRRRLPCGRAGRLRRDPTVRAALDLRGHERRDQGHAGRGHRQPRHAVGARRRGSVAGEGGQGGRRLRRLPRRRGAEHEGRCRPLSGLRAEAGHGHRPRRPHQRLPYGAAGGARAEARKQGAAGAHGAHCTPVARAAHRERGREAEAHHRSRTRHLQHAARASSIWPAPSATTTTGAGSWPASPCRRGTPPGTRSTAWNGRRWGRCSAACATA